MSKENRLKFSTEVGVHEVYNVLTKIYIDVITDYFELQRIWLNNAYVTFKDLDKYFKSLEKSLSNNGIVIICVPNINGMLYQISSCALELPVHLFHFDIF